MDKILRRRIQVSFYLQTLYYVQNVVIYLLDGKVKTATNINFTKKRKQNLKYLY